MAFGFGGLKADWKVLVAAFPKPIDTVQSDLVLLESLVRIVAVADEASYDAGAPIEPGGEDDLFLATTAESLEKRGTLCKEIHNSRLRVLPRMHTPQNGLTDRSLSLYLSLWDPCEVVPRWLTTHFIRRESFNILLIPWPFEVLVSQFRDVTGVAVKQLPEDQGFFDYRSAAENRLIRLVHALHAEANRKLGKVDGVVLPELAVSEGDFRALRKVLPDDCFLISGVSCQGRNELRLSFPPSREIVQKKHHPWKLNQAQTIQYGLGGVLNPSMEWWEYGDFSDRQLSFVSMSPDLVLTALVCEDLARPDPVANLVRTVGPNLVVALLMDGPQLKERWAARYATVLAEDPGSSVLALTSIGMSQLSRPQSGANRSRVIALWKDALNIPTEIDLPEGFDAIAISLSVAYREEFTGDGRGDGESAAFPILSGVHPVRVPPEAVE